MKVGSLFSGIGGFELGLQMASPDFEIAWQVERDEFCQKVLAKHWPDARRWDDVKTFPPEPVEDWAVDLICGGWPCQPVSLAGKREGEHDAKNRWLWPEFYRILSLLRPRWVLGENVTGLLSAVDSVGRRGGLFGTVLRDLASLGYCVEWHCIPASARGALHRRDRVWLICSLDTSDARSESTRLEEHRRSGQGRKTPDPPKPEVLRPEDRSPGSKRVETDGQDVPDADSEGLEKRSGQRRKYAEKREAVERSGGEVGSNPERGVEPLVGRPERMGRFRHIVQKKPTPSGFWSPECRLGLKAHGLPGEMGACHGWECGLSRLKAEPPGTRMPALRSLGNAVVPQVVEFLAHSLLEHENDQ